MYMFFVALVEVDASNRDYYRLSSWFSEEPTFTALERKHNEMEIASCLRSGRHLHRTTNGKVLWGHKGMFRTSEAGRSSYHSD